MESFPSHEWSCRVQAVAGLGNMVSDVAGLGLSNSIEVRPCAALRFAHLWLMQRFLVLASIRPAALAHVRPSGYS